MQKPIRGEVALLTRHTRKQQHSGLQCSKCTSCVGIEQSRGGNTFLTKCMDIGIAMGRPYGCKFRRCPTPRYSGQAYRNLSVCGFARRQPPEARTPEIWSPVNSAFHRTTPDGAVARRIAGYLHQPPWLLARVCAGPFGRGRRSRERYT